MSIEQLKNQLIDNAKDIKLNLSSILSPEGSPDLAINQIAGIGAHLPQLGIYCNYLGT